MHDRIRNIQTLLQRTECGQYSSALVFSVMSKNSSLRNNYDVGKLYDLTLYNYIHTCEIYAQFSSVFKSSFNGLPENCPRTFIMWKWNSVLYYYFVLYFGALVFVFFYTWDRFVLTLKIALNLNGRFILGQDGIWSGRLTLWRVS